MSADPFKNVTLRDQWGTCRRILSVLSSSDGQSKTTWASYKITAKATMKA